MDEYKIIAKKSIELFLNSHIMQYNPDIKTDDELIADSEERATFRKSPRNLFYPEECKFFVSTFNIEGRKKIEWNGHFFNRIILKAKKVVSF